MLKITVMLMFFSLLISACSPGFLYTNITVPLVTNMESTGRGSKLVVLETCQLKEPITGINLSAEWNSRAIGDAAKKKGLKEISFADQKTISIFGGIWCKETVRVWGE